MSPRPASTRLESKTHLLDLPFEIRDLVYTMLLDSEVSPPTSDIELPKSRTLFPFWQNNLRYIHTPPLAVVACQGLLRCNKQISQELLSKLQRRKVQGLNLYKLDCMIVRGMEICPSWLCISCPLRFLHTFQIDIRVLTSEIDALSRIANPTFKIMEMVEEFFSRGPTFGPVNQRREDIIANTLVFNVLPPTSPSIGFRSSSGRRRQPRLADSSIHPQKIYDTLNKDFVLLKRNLHGKVRLVRVCYEKNTSEIEI